MLHKINFRNVACITFQPAHRPALPFVYGPLDYREPRALFERMDGILAMLALEQEFINLALTGWKIDTDAISPKRFVRFARLSILAFRPNIARSLTGLSHRDFCDDRRRPS